MKQELKNIAFILRQAWGKAKNQELFMRSTIRLIEQGENNKALSLIKAMKEAQNSQNELMMAQIMELESRIAKINSLIKKPKYTTQDWEEHEQYKNGEIRPTHCPPMDAPPLTEEFYSEPTM